MSLCQMYKLHCGHYRFYDLDHKAKESAAKHAGSPPVHAVKCNYLYL